jgi:hypothetical protein
VHDFGALAHHPRIYRTIAAKQPGVELSRNLSWLTPTRRLMTNFSDLFSRIARGLGGTPATASVAVDVHLDAVAVAITDIDPPGADVAVITCLPDAAPAALAALLTSATLAPASRVTAEVGADHPAFAHIVAMIRSARGRPVRLIVWPTTEGAAHAGDRPKRDWSPGLAVAKADVAR